MGEEQAQGGGGELGEVQSERARVRGWEGGREGGGRGGTGGGALAKEQQKDTINGSPRTFLTHAHTHAHAHTRTHAHAHTHTHTTHSHSLKYTLSTHTQRPRIFEPERWPELVRLDLDVAQPQLQAPFARLDHFHPDERDLPTPLLTHRNAAPRHNSHPAEPGPQP